MASQRIMLLSGEGAAATIGVLSASGFREPFDPFFDLFPFI